ncbi:MAG: hypothetical protein ABIT05_09055 [Chitinophagaceae bacterium]
MKDYSFFKQLITSEIGGKNAAIHAYDGMVWKVRSGFLVLVFAGWSLMIKSVLEAGGLLDQFMGYILIYAAFSVLLALAAFFIDRNYARRKFRVIHDLDLLTQEVSSIDFEKMPKEVEETLIGYLKISGDTDNRKYRTAPYQNEMMVSRVIYIAPNSIILILLAYNYF